MSNCSEDARHGLSKVAHGPDEPRSNIESTKRANDPPPPSANEEAEPSWKYEFRLDHLYTFNVGYRVNAKDSPVPSYLVETFQGVGVKQPKV